MGNEYPGGSLLSPLFDAHNWTHHFEKTKDASLIINKTNTITMKKKFAFFIKYLPECWGDGYIEKLGGEHEVGPINFALDKADLHSLLLILHFIHTRLRHSACHLPHVTLGR